MILHDENLMIPERSGATTHMAIVLLVGFFIRLYAFHYNIVINEDGVFYINQAKALLVGDWNMATSCGFKFISLYHILIPIAYKIFGDWIIAAKSISLFFGTMTLAIVYLLFRLFGSERAAFVAALAFAVNPFFVEYSMTIVKDPIYWFFSCLGLLLIISVFRTESREHLLILGNLSFIMASLARFEIAVYILGTSLYILLFIFTNINRNIITKNTINIKHSRSNISRIEKIPL